MFHSGANFPLPNPLTHLPLSPTFFCPSLLFHATSHILRTLARSTLCIAAPLFSGSLLFVCISALLSLISGLRSVHSGIPATNPFPLSFHSELQRCSVLVTLFSHTASTDLALEGTSVYLSASHNVLQNSKVGQLTQIPGKSFVCLCVKIYMSRIWPQCACLFLGLCECLFENL